MKFKVNNLSVCLWFDSQAEEAPRHYASIFYDTAIGQVTCFGFAQPAEYTRWLCGAEIISTPITIRS